MAEPKLQHPFEKSNRLHRNHARGSAWFRDTRQLNLTESLGKECTISGHGRVRRRNRQGAPFTLTCWVTPLVSAPISDERPEVRVGEVDRENRNSDGRCGNRSPSAHPIRGRRPDAQGGHHDEPVAVAGSERRRWGVAPFDHQPVAAGAEGLRARAANHRDAEPGRRLGDPALGRGSGRRCGRAALSDSCSGTRDAPDTEPRAAPHRGPELPGGRAGLLDVAGRVERRRSEDVQPPGDAAAGLAVRCGAFAA